MKNTIFLAMIGLILLGGGCFGGKTQSEVDEVLDRHSILFEAKEQGLIMDDEEIVAMSGTSLFEGEWKTMTNVAAYLDRDVTGWSAGALADVTGGGSFGLAHTVFEAGRFTLIAKLGGLPDPAEGYFYEGWLVKRGNNLSVISTGPAVKNDDWYVNVVVSSVDLSDHDFYVLTLEPDDGDPAPAEHILEGIIKE
jgi:hypothetical protein